MFHVEFFNLPWMKSGSLGRKYLNSLHLQIWAVSEDSPSLPTKPNTTLTHTAFPFWYFQSKQRYVSPQNGSKNGFNSSVCVCVCGGRWGSGADRGSAETCYIFRIVSRKASQCLYAAAWFIPFGVIHAPFLSLPPASPHPLPLRTESCSCSGSPSMDPAPQMSPSSSVLSASKLPIFSRISTESKDIFYFIYLLFS